MFKTKSKVEYLSQFLYIHKVNFGWATKSYYVSVALQNSFYLIVSLICCISLDII